MNLTKLELKETFNNRLSGRLVYRLIQDNIQLVTELFYHTIPKELNILFSQVTNNDASKQKDILLELTNDLYMEDTLSFQINQNFLSTKEQKLRKLYQRLIEQYSIDGNIFDFETFYRLLTYFIRTVAHFLLVLVFRGMCIDIENDGNVSVDRGSLGTPGRVAKMWVGKDIYDVTEPLSGRFALEPELVTFPAKVGEIGKPVTITLTLNALCSHHLYRFGNELRNDGSKIIISYIPQKFVIGLSKINRWVDWIARRGWLQEELTRTIGEELKRKANTNDVYVGLINLQHGCVSFRGKNDSQSYTTTEYYSGKYEDEEFRDSVIGKFLK